MPSRYRTSLIGSAVLFAAAIAGMAVESAAPIEFKRDDDKGLLQVLIDGKQALVYCYGKDADLPHFYPVRSPSGKSMAVQQTEPFPHHRSFWFADTVQLEGQRQASFYNALYSGVGDKKSPQPPFRDRVRHVALTGQRSGTGTAEIGIRDSGFWGSRVQV